MNSSKIHIVILGPPAVGKFTVAKELSILTDFPVFDNAKIVDLVSVIHKYGTDEFRLFRDYLRLSFYFETVQNSKINGLISTNVLRHPSNWNYFDKVEETFTNKGWDTKYVLLSATVEELENRVLSENRKFKQALNSKESLRTWINCNQFYNDVLGHECLTIDTTKNTIEETTIQIIQSLNL